MGRSPCCSKEGLNKGAWTAMEDKILTEYIKVHGEGKWRHLPKRAGLKRCGKSCRLRWLNYLRPGIKRGNITNDEEELIIRLHNLLGNRWSLIAGRLPGRTDNEIKNYWNTNIGRKLQNCSIITNGARSSSNSVQYDDPNKASCVVQTKATRWPNNKVTLTKEIPKQNGQINDKKINNVTINNNTKIMMKGSFSPERNNNITIDPLDFISDFQVDGNLFSELLKMDFPDASSLCLENHNNNNNKMLEESGNFPCTFDDDAKGQLFPKSSNDSHYFPWVGDSLYDDTNFDFPPMATFMESGFDWL